MNWNISVACSRFSVSEDQPNSKWTTNDGCGCRGSDLQTECLLTLSVSLFVFLIFFSPVPRRFFELLFSSRFPWMWPWFLTDLWLCVGGFPVTARNSTKIGMQAKSSLWMGLMSICPARESCFFFLFWDLRFLLIKRSLLTTSLFMFFSAVLRCVILFFITFKGDCRGGNERF